MNDRWQERLDRLGLSSATLIGQSASDTAYRAYRLNGRAYKVAARNDHGPYRQQTLQGEFAVLRRCEGIAGVPAAFAYRTVEELEVLEASFAPGRPLYVSGLPLTTRLRAFARLAKILIELSRRGVSHNDVKRDNVLIDDRGYVTLIDFDQAITTSRYSAAMRNFLGRGKPVQVPVWGSFFSLLLDPLRARARHSFPAWLKRLLGRDATPPLPDIPPNADPALRLLRGAWAIARNSNASSPGMPIAYYSLIADGVTLPGERPWEARWEMLRPAVGTHVSRVLELGCNLGLLSSSLLRERIVEEALAVDHDVKILNGARLVAEAWGVTPHLRVQDFDAEEPWEDELAAFRPDLVFALNVLEWVHAKDRLLGFLGRFPEVVFEGHDDLTTEAARLRGVGFEDITLLGRSERDRDVLHCRQTP